MKENWNSSFDAVLRSEGFGVRSDNPYGFSNHPSDPGGVTQLGVTKRAWEAWVGHKVTIDDMKSLRPETVKPFYKKMYWDQIRGDDLPSGVDYAAYDFAVNSGVLRSIKTLQDISGTIVDGVLGLKSLAAIRAIPADQVIKIMIDHRESFLKRLPTWKTFGTGWSNRLVKVEGLAKRMA